MLDVELPDAVEFKPCLLLIEEADAQNVRSSQSDENLCVTGSIRSFEGLHGLPSGIVPPRTLLISMLGRARIMATTVETCISGQGVAC